MASQASRKHAPEAPVIPDRLYFKIGDVARICGVEAYVLRFWETQFPQLKPNKSGTGQRLYRRRDVEMVLEVQRLLHKEGFTIPGARHALEGAARHPTPELRPAPELRPPPELRPAPSRPDATKAAILQARAELKEIAAMLANPQPAAKRDRAKVVKVREDSTSLFPM
ncbi:MAG TPA: MerR family transcriptional regulator [Terracidiphilus sp.]|jgi:DNA-binding transcriptional MerR regulator|nr:MerR family transcriptional regulator [Terracidiphilus sp.]